MIMAIWQMREARARLGELIERTQTEGPQTITKNGKAKAVVLSTEAYQDMKAHEKRQEPNLIEFLLNSGPKLEDFEIECDRSAGREIDLE
jgi:prevent-host-death family protein